MFAICIIVEQDMEDRDNGQEAANARLIAASPDLLEACKQYIALEDAHDNPTDVDYGEAAVLLRRAIAKAEGK